MVMMDPWWDWMRFLRLPLCNDVDSTYWIPVLVLRLRLMISEAFVYNDC